MTLGSSGSIEGLIDPLSIDVFFDKHWQQQPLINHHSADPRFTDLVAVDDVETLATIGLSVAGPTATVLAARCVDNRADYWDIPRSAAPNVAVHSVLHAYRAGYSIVINAIDRFWAPVAQFARRLESAFQHPVSANLYLTPPGVQSFPTHFDKHDVLVTQIDGKKSWTLFEPDAASLHADADPWDVSDDEPAITTTLEQGSLLYVPRGWAHRVEAVDEPSLHVTFAIRTLRWADLVQRAVSHAIARDPALQEALPLHGDVDIAAINTRACELVAALGADATFDAHTSLLGEVLESRTPHLAGQLHAIAAVDLEPAAILVRRDGLRPVVTESADGSEVTIGFAGNGVTAPVRVRPAFELIARQRTCTVADLSAAIRQDATTLAEALIVNGLLRCGSAARS